MDKSNHGDNIHHTDDLDIMCSFNVHNNVEGANILTEEDMSVDSWRRRPKNVQKSRSHLHPNSTLQHLRMNNSKNLRSLPVLKNDSRADELKSCTIKNIGKIALNNTYAFDTLVSILMVSYSDSIEYCSKVDLSKDLVKDGVTAYTYTKRAEILVIF
jgi:hypothetical protein